MKPKIPVEQRFELQDLIARYAWSLDTGDADGYLDCFTEDGWIEHDPPGRCTGREQIRKLTDFLWYEHPNDYLGRQHRMSQVLMTPEGDGVRIKAFWTILQHDVDTERNFIFGLGLWDGLAVLCDDGDWRLKTLFVDIWRGKNVPWVGDRRAWTKRKAAIPAE